MTEKHRRGEPMMCHLCIVKRAGTKEDIIPKWARKRLNTLGEWANGYPTSVLIPLCSECNGAFGERFENRAAPLMGAMMVGEARELQMADQSLIARWIWKTSLLWTLAGGQLKEGPLSYAREALTHMKVNDSMPRSGFVRIGTLDPQRMYSTPWSMMPPHPRFYFHSPGELPQYHWYDVGTLGWIMWEAVIGDPKDMEQFINTRLGGEPLVRIWPVDVGAVSWPTSSLTLTDVEALRRAWRVGRWPPPKDAPTRAGVSHDHAGLKYSPWPLPYDDEPSSDAGS